MVKLILKNINLSEFVFYRTEEILEDDSYHFSGDGYSLLKGHGSSVYNKYVFTVSFNFKTYDENAVLFYAVAAKPVSNLYTSVDLLKSTTT